MHGRLPAALALLLAAAAGLVWPGRSVWPGRLVRPGIGAAQAAEPAAEPAIRGAVFSVIEIPLAGPRCGPADAPARDITLRARFRHESGEPAVTVHGFWDGDGKGGSRGNVFKVRFCPTRAGRWTLEKVESSAGKLAGRREGAVVLADPSDYPGFWMPDPASPGRRWYRRSDGSHPYIVGNTHYTFLSRMDDDGRRSATIADDVRANATCFNKLRFSINPCRYPDPTVQPYFDDAGRGTGDGDFSHRPNPAWFHDRVDAAVAACRRADTIADLILCGPDTREARSVLRARASGGDAAPLLRYVAARYGAYPNVWFCLANEWDIKDPKYTADEMKRFGTVLRAHLPYPTPVSAHAKGRPWPEELNGPPAWNDHAIIQKKIRRLGPAADIVARSHDLAGRLPVIDDELGYEGQGDRFTRDDILEGHLGAFLGGGYGTTGHKPANKKGHYFWGGFRPDEHTAGPNLAWLRKAIDRHVPFWTMAPVAPGESVLRGVPASARAMAAADGAACVLGTCEKGRDLAAELPAGAWRVVRLDAVAMKEKVLAERAEGRFAFDAPASRAVLFSFRRVEAK